MLRTLGAARAASRLRRGRVQAVESPAATPPLPLTRVTLIRPRPFSDSSEADGWLAQVCGDRDLWGALASEAGVQLNRALHAHRTAAADPYVADVDVSRAIAVRFGYGTGEEVADGRWRRADELAERERSKLLRRDYEALRPGERMAAVLSGRERVEPYEELVVRARGDASAGRFETAALGLAAAARAMLADPALTEHAAVRDSEALETLTALTSDVPRPTAADVEPLLLAAETILRRRRAAR